MVVNDFSQSSRFFVENKEQYIRASQHDYFSERKLEYTLIKNGYCLPTIRKTSGLPGEYMGGYVLRMVNL